MRAMRILLAACALIACDPAQVPFRARPPSAADAPVCGNLPRLAASADLLPIVDLDLDGDRWKDHVVTRAGTCDELGNCDRDLYVVRESCALAIGTVRAREVAAKHDGLLATEEVVLDGELGYRERRWRLDPATYRFTPAGEPVCKKRGSSEAVPCEPGEPGAPTAPEDPGAP